MTNQAPPDPAPWSISRPWPGHLPLSLFKVLTLAGIAVATLIPNVLVSGLVTEREDRQATVRTEVAQSWGAAQHVTGPVLVVPVRSSDGTVARFIEIAPRTLAITAHLAPETRKRGLFATTVYDAEISITGDVAVPDAASLAAGPDRAGEQPVWDERVLAIGVSSLTGLRSDDGVKIDGADTAWQPCDAVFPAATGCGATPIVLARLPAVSGSNGIVSFAATIHLRGTEGIRFVLPGKQATAAIDAAWSSPSFVGNRLPASATVTGNGFDATWQIADFGAPRSWTSGPVLDSPATASVVGVDLIEPAPVYRMITRVSKYGFLLVALSFAVYVLFEVLSGLRIHPMQYGLLALSLALFPLLLLSFGEFTGYPAGYAISAALVLGQASLYTASVARRMMPAALFAVMLAGLFGLLYVLLGLETYALLVGALALFAVLSALMVGLQRADWTGAGSSA